MAGDTDLFDLQEDGIAIAVDQNLFDELIVAAFFSLTPEAASAAAEIDRSPSFQRFLIRLFVHPGQHQHGAGGGILSDRREQAVVAIEIGAGWG